jgi:hypothetical protein
MNPMDSSGGGGGGAKTLWKPVVDPSSGKTYYVNRETKETVWKRPADADTPWIKGGTAGGSGGGAGGDALPDGWVEHLDQKKQKPYYVNSTLHKTQWVKPVAASAPLAAIAPLAVSVAVADEATKPTSPAPVDHATDKRASAEEEAGLPEGWIEKFDPKRNKPYYVNAELRETQWARPTAGSTPAEPRVEPRVAEGCTSALDSIKALAKDSISDLAEGWVEKFDAKKQKSYYVNATLEKTQWVKPVSASASVAIETAPVEHATDKRATAEEEAGLPEGWIEKFDATLNNPYYVNASNRITQWVRPEGIVAEPVTVEGSPAALDSIKALAADAVSDLAEGWVEKFDPKKQKPYYVNKAEKKTQWIKPVSTSAAVAFDAAAEPKPESPAPVEHATDKRATAEEEAGLPEGWIEKFDAQRNKPYYVNAALQKTQWTRPTAVVADESKPESPAPVDHATEIGRASCRERVSTRV